MNTERLLEVRVPGTEGGERLAVRLLEPAIRDPRCVPVLYLHGFGSRQDGEKANAFRASAAREGRPFASLDFRGHGASDGRLGAITLSRNLVDVSAARRALREVGWRRCGLFGSSMGGLTALWSAAREPADVAGLALIAPALGMLDGLERSAGAAGLTAWQATGRRRFVNELVDVELEWRLVDDLRRYAETELAGLRELPLYVAQGKLDQSVDWRRVAAFCEARDPSRTELDLFEGSGHRLLEVLPRIWSRGTARLDRS